MLAISNPGVDWQIIKARVGDIQLGVQDEQGVFWVLEDLEGFYDTTFDGSVNRRAWTHGGYYNPQWLAPRRFTMKVGIKIPPWNLDLLPKSIDRLKTVLPYFEPASLLVRTTAGTRELVVRVEDKITVKSSLYAARIEIPLVAADPTIYAADWDTGKRAWREYVLPLPHISGGVTFPLRFPFRFSGKVEKGEIEFNLPGSTIAYPIFEITGPVQQPTVIDTVTKLTFTYLDNLGVGEKLVIDTLARTVYLNGASRRGLFIGDFINLPPGNHTISWRSPVNSESARLKVRFVESYG